MFPALSSYTPMDQIEVGASLIIYRAFPVVVPY